MKKWTLHLAAVVVLSIFVFGQNAHASLVLCRDSTLNHMYVDSSLASACLLAGVGNLTGNPANDLFLNSSAGSGYEYINAGSFTQTDLAGTFTLAPSSIWDNYDNLAIGFKFGTGNQPDEWFVYELNQDVISGAWQFVDVFGKGGGLSHVNVYGDGEGGLLSQTPEPGTLILMGTGLSIMLIRSRLRAKK
jgi:hypothetical protein